MHGSLSNCSDGPTVLKSHFAHVQIGALEYGSGFKAGGRATPAASAQQPSTQVIFAEARGPRDAGKRSKSNALKHIKVRFSRKCCFGIARGFRVPPARGCRPTDVRCAQATYWHQRLPSSGMAARRAWLAGGTVVSV